ncbi:hypothetical protein BCR34DRAFT_603293 [Clohesyomyces aquaticus]|uniref:MYND-type domain-containing protein n=1 Tax=Clohesyomyces aquaticus TaxID=1231657 RepID=A0A1Y1ZES9_9PLEO|nr:hypothetical protein BCR34DRAFT_603293 [Clohesyomyces aquaticus]
MPDPKWPDVIPIPNATGDYLSPNVATTKRTDFTDFFLRFQPAEDAHIAYKNLFLAHQKLIKLLIDHPAMRPNLEQTFNTPANSKNKVYFMWDFLLRTFQHLAAKVSPQDPYSSPMFSDVIGRSSVAMGLMLDETGMLEAGNASVGYRDDAGVEFTDEIKELAVKLEDLGDGCAGCGKLEREGGKALMRCARCKGQNYCSKECQKKCWKDHKRNCVA